MGNHTQVKAVSNQGDQFQLQHTSTDSPILPVESMRELMAINPKLVDFVVEETRKEAAYRRSEQKKVDWFIFIERIAAIGAPVLVAIVGLVLSAAVIYYGHDWAGVAIGGASLGTIVTIIAKAGNKQPDNPAKPPNKQTTRTRQRAK